jgi:ABC-type Fe3+/spermidine/putrescine transport system ATPase subunit
VREEIRQIQQRLGLTAVYVTHDQEEAMAVSDRIIVMKNAEIAQEGTPQDLYDRPNSAFIADFIGDANLVPVEVTRTGAAAEVRLLDRPLQIPVAWDVPGPAHLVLRPHHLHLTSTPTPATLPAEVAYTSRRVLPVRQVRRVALSVSHIYISISFIQSPFLILFIFFRLTSKLRKLDSVRDSEKLRSLYLYDYSVRRENPNAGDNCQANNERFFH